jgi:hypothetical protein
VFDHDLVVSFYEVILTTAQKALEQSLEWFMQYPTEATYEIKLGGFQHQIPVWL